MQDARGRQGLRDIRHSSAIEKERSSAKEVEKWREKGEPGPEKGNIYVALCISVWKPTEAASFDLLAS